MLPKNQLRTQLLEKLKVFREDHDIIGFPNVKYLNY